MKLYTTGEAAEKIGTTINRVASYSRNPDFPEPSSKIGRFKAYSEEDILTLYTYLYRKGLPVEEPKFTSSLQPTI